jgi:mono/diheme cytochrome c family protein
MRAPRCAPFLALFVLFAASAPAQDAAKLFEDNCAMCHAVGGPPSGAPDLKDVTKRRDHTWLVRFILNPEAAAKVDADAAAIVKQFDGGMPVTEGATPEIVEAILRYIDTASGSTSPAPAEIPPPPARVATAVDIDAGRDFYVGRRPLGAGAPSCVSCHRLESLSGLGGGTLGPDLTRAHQRLGGTRAVATWLANPPTRVMRAVFRKQPLAAEESFTLAALLADTDARQAPAAASRTPAFVGLGTAGALTTLLLIGIVWSRRLRAVRRPLLTVRRIPYGGDR